jgi:hypothetical protein
MQRRNGAIFVARLAKPNNFLLIQVLEYSADGAISPITVAGLGLTVGVG